MSVLILPTRQQLMRGMFIAIVLWIAFMVGTAYTSAATLLDRVASTDVMRAAADGGLNGKVAWEVSAFLVTQVLLHLTFAGLTWVLAYASAVAFETARKKFGRIVVGWFCVLAGASLAYNALWFPRTLIGAYYHDIAAMQVVGIPVGRVVYTAAFVLCGFVAMLASLKLLRSLHRGLQKPSIVAATSMVLACVVAAVWSVYRSDLAAAASSSRPNVIVIGIDSLRLEQLARFGGTGLTPNLDRFLADADIFKDTTTPLGRTFSSWMAILTGRSPPVTGARFNLAERSSVRANPTVADILRQNGYRTIYSTDEVRFANIDESYGFDQVFTPRIGASDFLIGTYNEMPLASLIINTRLGRWLFPFSYANRGVATMFQPETYLEMLDWKVSIEQPTLLIAHLTAAHWPYYTADTPFGVDKPVSAQDRPMYRIGLQTADRMFGELVDLLRRKGALDNALVIVLSDHGEAMGLPSDSFFDETFRVQGLKAPLKMDDFGHGQSVLSRSQYQVLLGVRTFGPTRKFGNKGRDFAYPVTVEDIAPTILEFLGVSGNPLAATGSSLLSKLESGRDGTAIDPERIRFTETDLRVLPAPGGGVDEVATARRNSVFFEVDSESARLHIRPLMAPLAVAFKERAAFTRDCLLAAIPAGPYAHQYIYIDFAKRHGRLLLERPGNGEPVAQRLWDALAENYKGELMPPVSITPADWVRIAHEWENFLQARDGTKARPRSEPEAG